MFTAGSRAPASVCWDASSAARSLSEAATYVLEGTGRRLPKLNHLPRLCSLAPGPLSKGLALEGSGAWAEHAGARRGFAFNSHAEINRRILEDGPPRVDRKGAFAKGQQSTDSIIARAARREAAVEAFGLPDDERAHLPEGPFAGACIVACLSVGSVLRLRHPSLRRPALLARPDPSRWTAGLGGDQGRGRLVRRSGGITFAPSSRTGLSRRRTFLREVPTLEEAVDHC